MQPPNITLLEQEILATHGCRSVYSRTEFVRQRYPGSIKWTGFVFVFKLINHQTAERCFAWNYRDGDETHAISLLEIAPIDSAEKAVAQVIAATTHERAAHQAMA